MLKYVPVSLAAWRSLSKTPLVVVFLVVALMKFRMPVFRLVALWMVFGVVGDIFLICGHVRRTPIEESASSKVTFDVISLSATARAVVSAVSLHVISVCDLTLLAYVGS